MIGFTGSRKGFEDIQLVKTVALSVFKAGHSVSVGCARGVDALIRKFIPAAQVFRVASPAAGSVSSAAQALARRSMSMVNSCSVLVGFASVACPVGVSPSHSFSGGGSGTWASIAYAISKGLRVFIFVASDISLPAWSGGSWVQACPSGLWSQAYIWQPSANQLSLI